MNQKGLAPIIIILLFVVVSSVIVAGVWLQSSGKNNFLSNLKAPSEGPEETISQKRPTGAVSDQKVSESESALVVKAFCDNFFQGPPALNEQGIVAALDLLSQKARQSISTVGPSPSAALLSFTGVQDIPDKGYSVGEVFEEAEKVTVKTTWKYSSGPMAKTFELVKEGGSWKIDFIQ
jgi:hypothetical protein